MSEHLRTPVIFVNFKTYKEVDGEGALKLARICEDVSKESGISIVVCPPMVELGVVARNVSIPVFSQNIDWYTSGSGWITASMIKSTGAIGTLINHSEHKLENSVAIQECIRLSKAGNLITVVCAESVEKAVDVALYIPNFVAIEPPELIGGNISVTTANPHIIEETVCRIKDINSSISVLCGAGIKNKDDIVKAVDLGVDGVLIASGIVKSEKPRETLRNLATFL